MRLFSVIFIISMMTINVVFSQPNDTSNQDYYKISKINDGLYFMFIDSTNEKKVITKSTIVEFDNFIALLETPIYNHKKSTEILKDHTIEGEKIISSLKAYFPYKPLKYVFSSHWHPHSLSSVIPFVTRGITIITTNNNFRRLSDFIDSAFFQIHKEYFHFVDDEVFNLKDNSNEIVVYKVDKKEYTSLPTQDYLYFYLGKYNYLHVSCMYQRFPKSIVKGQELLSPRTEDLINFIQKKKILPDYLISMDPYFDESNNLISGDTLCMLMDKGLMPSVLEKYIYDLANDITKNNPDSIFKEIYNNSIPKYLINSTIYKLLKEKKLNGALELSKFQAIYYPSDINAWDTLGEVYYFSGDISLAKRYASECLKINKDYKDGGISVWEKDLQDYQKIWELDNSK
ncbi:MAG: hypothetical protein V1779_12585 [bacterium]